MSESGPVDYESIECEIEVIEDPKQRKSFQKDMEMVDKAVFPKKFFDKSEITKGLVHERSVLVLLRRDDTGEVVGYGFASPTSKDQVAHNVANAILPEFQGKGYIADISEAIEEELRDLGYVFFTRETKEADGYADKVRKTYGDRITKEEKGKNKMGKTRVFTIVL